MVGFFGQHEHAEDKVAFLKWQNAERNVVDLLLKRGKKLFFGDDLLV